MWYLEFVVIHLVSCGAFVAEERFMFAIKGKNSLADRESVITKARTLFKKEKKKYHYYGPQPEKPEVVWREALP